MFNFFINVLLSVFISFTYLNSEEFQFDFNSGHEGWIGDFSDYPAHSETFYELSWGWSNLPSEATKNDKILTKGMFLSGNNHSDDLFMFIKHPIEGLKPNTEYSLHFFVTILNDIPPEEIGIGGSPGEGVYFKIGASTIEPKKENKEGSYLLNVDKGDQSQEGKNSLVVGTLENPLVDPSDRQYKPKEFSNSEPLRARTDEKGNLWIFVGTDSGFEGSTLYYIAHLAVFAEANEELN